MKLSSRFYGLLILVVVFVSQLSNPNSAHAALNAQFTEMMCEAYASDQCSWHTHPIYGGACFIGSYVGCLYR